MAERVIFHVDVNSAFLSWTAAYRVKVLGESFDLRDVPQHALSFTLGDSMSVVDRQDRAVYLMDELAALLAAHGLDKIRADLGLHYIEAQLWTKQPPESRRISPCVEKARQTEK